MVRLRDGHKFEDLPAEKRGPSALVACDPSLHGTGFAVFNDGELSRTFTAKVPAKFTGEDAEDRLMTEVALALRRGSNFTPCVSVIEDPRLPPIPGKSNFKTSSAIGFAYGVACGALRSAHGPALFTYGVATWKAAFGLWPQGDRKTRAQRSLRLASYYWPKHDFSTSDEVDAALLGEYALSVHWLKSIKGVLG